MAGHAVVNDVLCTFDNGLCQWKQSTADDFDWSRGTATTTSRTTGPNGDHTSGAASTGHYMFTEASDPRTENQTADLISASLPAGQDFCFHLYTNRYGSNMGVTAVMVQNAGHGSTPRLLKSYTSHTPQPTWEAHNVYIPAQTNAFNIVIRGYIGSSYASDMAIGDVSMTKGSCPPVKTG